MFKTYSKLSFFIFLITVFFITTSQAQTEKLQSEFKDGIIYVQPVTATGKKLNFYIDTGGGANMLFPETVKKLGLKEQKLQIGKSQVTVVDFPKFKSESSIPLPLDKPPFGKKLFVPAENQLGESGADGFLGRTWFAGKIWEFDYPGKSVSLLKSYSPSASEKSHTLHLGFRKDKKGNQTTYFPTVVIVVDGDSLNMLFDTGAFTAMKDSAYKSLKDGLPQQRATSFIVQALFEKWKKKHPKWKVVEDADKMLNMPMIKVPEISVAGYKVGPVWFTMRPDINFYNFMSKFTDQVVDGAIGGSALQYFKVIASYPGEFAVFSRPAK